MDPNMARAISGPANLMSKKMPLLFSKVAVGRAAARLGIGQYQVGDRGGMKALACAAALLGLAAAGPANALTILFVGNSFTYGEHSAAKRYHPETVTDLNGPDLMGRTFGGMPAIFKAFTEEAGLDYQVSLETVPGVGLDYHYSRKLPLIDRAWDEVVLQSYSTLDLDHPADPALLVQYAKQFDKVLKARNPQSRIFLSATWSRPDLTYRAGQPWSGKSIEHMALDVQAGYETALRATPTLTGVIPIGLAFNRAMAAGLADPNPYDGIGASQIDLWAYDKYHASVFGYYLEALMVFGRVTGRDPLSLTAQERVAEDFGFDPVQTQALQQIAHDQLAAAPPN